MMYCVSNAEKYCSLAFGEELTAGGGLRGQLVVCSIQQHL